MFSRLETMKKYVRRLNKDLHPFEIQHGVFSFLARLHFSAEELLLYPRRPRPRQRPHAKC